MNVYFDNAATTALDPLVLREMVNILENKYGNPSSIHSFGREAKAIVERSRKTIATYLNVSPSEIFFTSGGTEADNQALRSALYIYKVKHIISSPIEHHAVLHTIEELVKHGKVTSSQVKLTANGHIDMKDLEHQLEKYPNALVSLMHANNEIGNILDIEKVGELCKKHNALFHSDTVQSICHYPLDVQKINVDFIACAAHKFHGPKGSGFIYIRGSRNIVPLIFGGGQERNMRGGTENVAGIAGLAKAFQIAHTSMPEHSKQIQSIKSYMIEQLENELPGVEFNGDYLGNSLYTVLNVMLPETNDFEMMLMKLDMNGIAASAGSACSSGSNVGSHVITALGKNLHNRPVIRFSFSKYNTKEEVDYCVETLKSFYQKIQVATEDSKLSAISYQPLAFMQLSDTHTHLFLPEFDSDRKEVIQRAIDKGVTRMFLPNIDVTTVSPLLKTCDEFPGSCFPMMGLHPCSVNANYKNDLAEIKGWFDKKKFYGVGEIGLDFYHDITFKEQQKEALGIQIQWAKEMNLPIVLHCRNSFNEVMEIVTELHTETSSAQVDEKLKGIFHCFTGTVEEARKVMELKTFKMGIGGVVTYKKSTLPQVLSNVPLQYLVLETDSPYLTPVPFRGKRNESSYLHYVAEKLAEIYKLSVEEIAKVTGHNAVDIFRK